ncbi:rfbP protein [Vibrio cholerae]|uniref:RfbP protein n=1 Tax=Vibrio cholerae TaxID=666 RepID=A0A544C8J9_VIBCL|nr:rfbP protein [Vibrio cholerae]TQP14905.1 rfbP protein [Vibrio cholerae]TQQ53649.1 rfbP protein [Vibrio cholerae]TVM55280.1 rfbP protein [Vibrio cholerae]TVN06792.1 rfbP protein [Vibrio cholerae]
MLSKKTASAVFFIVIPKAPFLAVVMVC